MADETPLPREIPQSYQTGRRGGSSSTRSYHSEPSRRGDRIGGTVEPWAWDHWSAGTARALVLISLIYSAWRFGGVDASGQFHVCVLLAIASVLTLTTRRAFSRKSRRLPVTILAVALFWIAYAMFQSLPLAAPMKFVFAGSSSVNARMADPALGRLESAIEQIDETWTATRSKSYASVVPHQSRQAMVRYILAFAAIALSAILFDSRQSRTMFLWVLVVHTSLLAAWGIVQRAGGDAFILPGVENTFSRAPFASFVYKNAGAAALLPGLAAIAALLYGQRGGEARARSKDRSTADGWFQAHNVFLLQPRTLTLIALASLLITALFASLSRGAWATTLITAVVVGISSRFHLSKVQLIAIVVSALLLIGSVAALTGIENAISDRANQMTVSNFKGDQRWEHWQDGARAAWFYAPGGSGLGTYGYATLPLQSEPRRLWFREAHNQYLEVATEMGIAGLILSLVVVGWLAVTSWRLLRQDAHREKSSWGLLGCAILLCGAIQSSFDFVLLMPANMMLYASLFGVVAAAERSYAAYLKSRRVNKDVGDGAAKDPIQKTEMRYSLHRIPAVWMSVSLGMLLLATVVAFRSASAESLLDRVREMQVDGQPVRGSVNRQWKLVDDAISWQPDRGDLYRRRANLSFTKYRFQLIDLADEADEQLKWEDTRAEVLASTIVSVDESARSPLVEYLLKTPRMREEIASALKDYANSIRHNPLDPITHANCLSIAPLTGMPVEPWIESHARLNLNDMSALYFNGFVALQNGLKELALDQWSKSIAINHQHLEDIYAAASQKLTATEIATHVVPPHRASFLVHMVRDASKKSLMHGADVGEELIEFLESDIRFDPDQKEATLAGIHETLGDNKTAVRHWKRAHELRPRYSNYRWSLAESLRRNGEFDEALQHSVLGETLHADDPRFTRLTVRIRQEISRQRKFD